MVVAYVRVSARWSIRIPLPYAQAPAHASHAVGEYGIVRSPMPWRCPACQQPIQHSSREDYPRVGVLYRCHVCRLELTFDEHAGRLNVTAFPSDDVADTRQQTDKPHREA